MFYVKMVLLSSLALLGLSLLLTCKQTPHLMNSFPVFSIP
jgi:hypothetical protein